MNQSEEMLYHYGILRRSGRYPWGSGKNPNQRQKLFLNYYNEARAKGMTDAQIAKAWSTDDAPMTSTDLRALKSIAVNAQQAANIGQATRLKAAGNSTSAIAREMGVNESTVRGWLAPGAAEKNAQLVATANVLRKHIGPDQYLDFGAGTENHLGVSKEKLSTAVSMLEQEGYKKHYLKVTLQGTGKETTLKVLTEGDVTSKEVFHNQDRIKSVAAWSEDAGRSFITIQPPQSVSSKRVEVRYGPDGGATKDGVIELRRGVPDLDLGNARYAQVRIAVDGTHYLKGMAMYADDLPDGVDMRFNTNKKDKGNKLAAMKEIKDDPENPFGSVVRQKYYTDEKGRRQLSPLNIVGTEDPEGVKRPGEEGAWYNWSTTISSQALSKQSPDLAKKQLGEYYANKQAEFDEINALTNPVVKKKLLMSFGDDADSAAVHLKAAGLPRTRNHVLIPINSMKDTEIYAPNYNDGEKVVLIRHPHGGIFEIPELTVNNKNPDGRRILGNAADAVGINHKVASQLSGADFDGDTVLVIPNKQSGPDRVKTKSPLRQLEGFDPQAEYKPYDGMRTIDGGTYNASTGKVVYPRKADGTTKGPDAGGKQKQMGQVSNLITDMTIKEASDSEIARAVRHSMVVIDAEKHVLDYKRSEQDNGIKELKVKYQSDPDNPRARGASTLISRASSDIRVPYRRDRKATEGGPIDKETGKRVYVYEDKTYVDKKTGKVKARTVKSTKLAEADDAYTLSSGTVMEAVYADHSNRMKSLANEARRIAVNTPNSEYNPSAAKAYRPEVTSLRDKLDLAQKAAPLERQAQLIAGMEIKAKKQANPNMSKDEEKKVRSIALANARTRTGSKKQNIVITDKEWDAIQAGAVSSNMLNKILANTDLNRVKELATPRQATVMVPAKLNRAKAMLASGYTPAQVAKQLGVPVSTLNSAIKARG